jgi:hypothetical protein
MKHLYLSCLLCVSAGISMSFAQQAITAANTTNVTVAAGTTYNANGAAGSGLAANNYDYRYGGSSGSVNNKVFLNNFTAGGITYVFDYGFTLNVVLNRVNNPVVTGLRDLLYNEGAINAAPAPDQININAPYVASMAALFIGNDDLRSGTDNLFGNQGDGSGNNNNIERLDLRINGNSGYLIGDPALEGFAVFERGVTGSHDPFTVSIITSLDGTGNPNGYTGLFRATTASYGATNPIGNADYIVLRRDGGAGNLQASATPAAQGVGGIFFRFSDFGLTPGTRVYGYSLAGNDFPVAATAAAMVNYNNATNFPINTTSATTGGGIDLSAITGVFKIFNDDNDPVPNNADIDDDNDGIPDLAENGGADAFADADSDGILNYLDPSYPGFTDSNGDNVNDNFDADLDGKINQLDLDSDNDGIPDIAEAGGVDTNGDGRIDGAFADADGDGLHDTYDASTGGDAIANRNTDSDAVNNAYDLDSDNDGIPDVVEAGGTDVNNDGRIDGYTDADSDGFSDTADADTGNDGIAENTAAALLITGADTDSDGDPDSYPRANTDNLGLPNPYDLDADGDGILDTREGGLPDANNNGIADGTLGADGWSDVADALPSLNLPNSDGAGPANYLDIDADDDGLTDNIEGQTTLGYQLPSGTDTDGDGIDNIYDNNDAAFAGNANNGITPYNHDAADIPDYIDSDTDNDTVNDLKEGSGNVNAALTNKADTDVDGLVDQFDILNLNTVISLIQNNVTITGMGNGGSLTGPTLAGSNIIANQTPGTAPNRDWRNNMFVLPVRFVDIRLTITGNIHTIAWTVADELNVKEYIIERSFDGVNFIAAGTVAYRNNGGGEQTYSFNDVSSLGNNGTVYYRIRQVDIDGRFMISKVVLYKEGNKKNGLLVLGNPVSANEVILNITAERSGIAEIRLLDMKGRVLASQKNNIGIGNTTIKLSVKSGYMASGAYFIKAVIGGQSFIEKITVNR